MSTLRTVDYYVPEPAGVGYVAGGSMNINLDFVVAVHPHADRLSGGDAVWLCFGREYQTVTTKTPDGDRLLVGGTLADFVTDESSVVPDDL